jgi:pyrroline-5-carboxylate reductase
MMKLGVLGVGDLTEKMVRGLHRAESGVGVLLSPRNRERAEQLADELGCRAMPTNQAVVDAADVVLVGVRPAHLRELAEQVTLKPGQALVSVVAGVSVHEIEQMFGARPISRAMVSLASEINRSTVAVFPAKSAAAQVFAPLGNLVPLATEREFELAMIAACANGWFYFLLDEMQRWFMRHGMAEDTARNLMLSSMEDCVAYARFMAASNPGEIGKAIATPGTYTANGLSLLNERGANAAWSAASDRIFEALMAAGK